MANDKNKPQANAPAKTGEQDDRSEFIKEMMAMADAALSFLENAVPRIEAAFKRGEISQQEQKTMMDRMDGLRSSNFQFTRPAGS